MDYSTRPQGNLDPGLINFELLADIYGTATPQTSNTGGNRRRRTGSVIDLEDAVPDYVTKKYKKAVQQIEGMVCRDCLVDLGDGYTLEVHQLGVDE
jgi:hypothetical protein